MEGGSGRATVQPSAEIYVKDGLIQTTIIWSSSNYDYMIVNDVKYINENVSGNSTFTFPIPGLNQKIPVIGDTTAMSVPHEIEYTLYFELE